MRCSRSLALAAAAVALSGLAARPTGAADEAVRIPTQFVTQLQLANQGGRRPGDLVAELQEGGSVPLTTQAPPGTGAVPPGSRIFGQFPFAGRTWRIAIAPTDGGQALVGIDLDGDGNVRGETEVHAVEGRPSKSGGRACLRYRVPTQVRGTLKLDLSFQHLARTFNAVLLHDQPQPLELSATPPAGCTALATQAFVRYAAIPTAAGSVSLAFVRSDGERLTVLADTNRNGILGDGGETFPVAVEAREPGSTFWRSGDLAIGGGSLAFAFQELAPAAEATWRIGTTGARRGQVTIGGVPFALHLLDADFDGSFTSRGDWWWFGPTARLARFTQLLPVSMMEAKEPFYLDGAWRLISLDADGNAVVMKDLGAPHPNAYLHRRTTRVNETRWFPSFSHEDAFVEKWAIDTSRPQATEPLHWLHDVSLDAALRKAKAEGKPLLVDFEADWCSNCKRWDFHVYADREVALLLSRFLLLKVNVDFNLGDDIERLGGENPPYLVFLDGDGNPLLSFPKVDRTLQATGETIPGLMYFQRPADFAATVRAAWDAFQN